MVRARWRMVTNSSSGPRFHTSPVTSGSKAQARQAGHHVGHVAEAAALGAVAVDERLPALEHEVDHDGRHGAVGVVVDLARGP